MFAFLIKKFIAGNNPEEALKIAKNLMKKGFLIDLNILGENEELPDYAFKKYYDLIKLMKKKEVFADISLKLSHFGVSKNLHLIKSSILHLAEELKLIRKKITIDIENEYIDFLIYKTMDYLIEHEIANVGMALALNRKRIHVPLPEEQNLKIDYYINSNHLLLEYPFCAFHRICKGAEYKEHKKNHLITKSADELFKKYILFFESFVSKKIYAGFAVARDLKLIQKIISLAEKNRFSKNDFEFQMLYGVRMDIAKWLLKQGYRVRIYLPFLYNEPYKKAIPYFLRRCSFEIFKAIIKEKIRPLA
jgi:proline dehydrogenase